MYQNKLLTEILFLRITWKSSRKDFTNRDKEEATKWVGRAEHGIVRSDITELANPKQEE